MERDAGLGGGGEPLRERELAQIGDLPGGGGPPLRGAPVAAGQLGAAEQRERLGTQAQALARQVRAAVGLDERVDGAIRNPRAQQGSAEDLSGDRQGPGMPWSRAAATARSPSTTARSIALVGSSAAERAV